MIEEVNLAHNPRLGRVGEGLCNGHITVLLGNLGRQLPQLTLFPSVLSYTSIPPCITNSRRSLSSFMFT